MLQELLGQFITYGRMLTPEDMENLLAWGLEEKAPTLEAFREQVCTIYFMLERDPFELEAKNKIKTD